MAGTSTGAKKYVVNLSAEERERLEALISSGKRSAQLITKARILLKTDASEAGEGWTDREIAAAWDTSVNTVGSARRQLVEEGFEATLLRKYNPNSARPRIFDGAAEAKLIALACSPAPEGRLANAAHVKNVPGRKTDVNDATWLSELAAHGLIRGSFASDRPTQELRSLLRTRKRLVRERSSHIQRPHLGGLTKGVEIGLHLLVDPRDRPIEGVDLLQMELEQEAPISDRTDWARRFPSDGHLLSWACICPRNDESAGKRRSTRMRKGSRWLKATLFSCALGGRQNQRQLLPGPVPPNQGSPRGQKGHRRRRRLPPAHHPSHAQGRHSVPGFRRRPLRQATQDRLHPSPCPAPPEPRVRRSAHPSPRMTRV